MEVSPVMIGDSECGSGLNGLDFCCSLIVGDEVRAKAKVRDFDM